MVLSKAMRRILLAREKVARRNVFFASILYTARLIETDLKPHGMATMFTNGIDVYFHPDFVKENDAHIEGVLLHEVLHCAFNHVGRRQWRRPILFNLAADYAINPLVTSVYQLPKGALIDQAYDGLSAERIYEKLEQKYSKQKQKGQGEPGEGDEQSGRMVDPTPEELEEAEREWRRVVKVATEKAEKAGQLHGQLKRLVEEIFPQENIDWRLLLEDMARDAKENVSTCWHRPNRRFIGQDIIMPGISEEKIYRVVACIDTSGSVTDDMVKEMKGELMSLLEQQIVTSCVLISTDTKVCAQAECFTPEEIKNFDMGPCGGGTQFDEAMKAVAEVEEAIGCIFLTDCQTASWGKDPGMPFIAIDWTNQANQQIPFGRVVKYK